MTEVLFWKVAAFVNLLIAFSALFITRKALRIAKDSNEGWTNSIEQTKRAMAGWDTALKSWQESNEKHLKIREATDELRILKERYGKAPDEVMEIHPRNCPCCEPEEY